MSWGGLAHVIPEQLLSFYSHNHQQVNDGLDVNQLNILGEQNQS